MRVSSDSLRQARLEICTQLEARRNEIERDLLNRVKAIAYSDDITDPEYVDGLPRAVAAGLAHTFDGIKCSERHTPPIPAVLLSQARLAARNGLSIDVVVRRCAACDTLIKDLLTKEAEETGLVERVKLSDLLRAQGVIFDRIVTAVSDEHRRERENFASPELRLLKIVKGLLAGEILDTSELRYDFDAFHIAAIARGPGASSVIKGLASALDCTPFLVRNADGAVWAWLGRRERPNVTRIEKLVTARWPKRVHLSIGEPAQGRTGWRQTHNQATAAFLAALYRPGNLIRYAEDPLLFTAMRDDLLSNSLHDLYLIPLAGERDGGAALRRTLRAYFAAGCNGASAAHVLKVSRQTVKNRIQTVETRVGRPIAECAAELEAALHLDHIKSKGYTDTP
jgi:hypothetical protein